ncbi:unnamed protein product [Caretta caretta]
MINWLKGMGQCQRINGCGKTDDHIVGELGQAKYQMKGLGMEAEGGLYGGHQVLEHLHYEFTVMAETIIPGNLRASQQLTAALITDKARRDG